MKGLSRLGGLLCDFGFSPVSDFEGGPKEERFFDPGIGDVGFLLAEGQLEVFSQEYFDFLLDVLCEGVAPTDSYHPIIRISEVFYPDEIRVVYLLGRGVSQLFNGQFEFLGSCFSLRYQEAFLIL